MRIIGLANHKGGVAKTTTAVNLAASIAAMGRSVLLIDCDPQASASRWLGFEPASGRPFLEDVFAGEATLAESTYPTKVERVSLVPSSSQLAVQDRLLAGKPAPAAVLLRALRATPASAFDYALLDSPPQLGMLPSRPPSSTSSSSPSTPSANGSTQTCASSASFLCECATTPFSRARSPPH
jgi:chromosome partitioning protein